MSSSRTLDPARRRRFLAILMLLVVVTELFGVASAADPGDLDPAFGEGGRVFGPNGRAHGIAAIPAGLSLPQGTLVVTGCLYANSTCQSLALARFTPGGQLDRTFGTNGVRAYDFDTSSIDAGYAVAVQGSGDAARLVVAGAVGNQTAIVRFNLDGTLDEGFSGDGKTIIPGQRAVAVGVDGDDLLVAGRDGVNFVVARLSSGDHPTWIVTTNFGGASSPSSLALTPAGLVVAGKVTVDESADGGLGLVGSSSSDAIALARYNVTTGALDSSFAGGGKVVGPAGSAAAVLADGNNIVVAGRRDDRFLIARFNRDGELDPAFNASGPGTAIGPVGAATGLMRIGPYLYVSGRSNPEFFADSTSNSTDMVITRRHADTGAIDNSFGSGGVVVTDFGAFIDDATGLLEHGGKPVIAGHTGRHSPRMALARFEVQKRDDVADITVTVTAAPDPVRVGGNLVYTAQVFNRGPDPAYRAKVDGSTDFPMTFISADISIGVCVITQDGFNCDIGGLPAGRSTSLTLLAVPTVVGTANLDWRAGTASRDLASGNDTATSSTQVVRAPGKWSPTGSHLLPRSHHKAVVLEGPACLEAVPRKCGQALVVSGDSAELFDPVSRRWLPTGPPSVSHLVPDTNNAPALFTLTLLEDGRVLLVGGESAPKVAEIYDPRTGTWRPTLGSLNDPRAGHVAVRLPDGRVLIAGGAQQGEPGPISQCPGENLRSAEIFDPRNGERFTKTLNDMNFGRGASHQATGTLLANGDVLVVGGPRGPSFDDDQNGLCRGTFASPEIFDPEEGWRRTGDSFIPRANHTATRLPNGKVLVAGGRTSLEQITTASAEIYDPEAIDETNLTHFKGAWEGAPSMGTGRERHSAVALPHGTVLVTGGAGSDRNATGVAISAFPVFSTTEIFHGRRWGSGGVMTTPRFAHAIAAFPAGPASHCAAVCGRILVTGGLVHKGPSATNLDAGGFDRLVSADLYTLDPGVEHLDPAEGPVTGGTRVAISGLSLAGATKVVFGGEPPLECGAEGSAKCWVDPELPDVKIHAISPPHLPPEKVHVTVTTEPQLTSVKTDADLFTYGLPGLPPLPGGNDLAGGEGTFSPGSTDNAPPAVPGGPASSLGGSPATQAGASQGTVPGTGFFSPPHGVPALLENPAVVTAANSDLAAAWTSQPALVTAPHASATAQREEQHPAPRYSFSVLSFGLGLSVLATGWAVQMRDSRRRPASHYPQRDRAVPAIGWTT